jgi:hypothetical protein
VSKYEIFLVSAVAHFSESEFDLESDQRKLLKVGSSIQDAIECIETVLSQVATDAPNNVIGGEALQVSGEVKVRKGIFGFTFEILDDGQAFISENDLTVLDDYLAEISK